MSQAKLQKKAAREAQKRQMMKLGSDHKRVPHAPDFSFKESDLLALKQTVTQLVQSNNNIHALLEDYHQTKEKALHAHYMGQVILKILVDAKIVTEAEVDEKIKKIQKSELNLTSRGDQEVSQHGDTLLISFVVLNQNEVVIDESKAKLAYQIGSNTLPCDSELVGLSKGESRTLDVVFTEEFKVRKDLIGKNLVLHLTCHDILSSTDNA